MTDEAKALVERLKDEKRAWSFQSTATDRLDAIDLIETQAREIERLREANDILEDGLQETAMTSEDDFAPIWEESILLAEHEAVQASVYVGGWLSAALDDPNVCDQMKADINRWFSAGFLYLDSVRQLMQADREAVRDPLLAEIERLREALKEIMDLPGEINPSNYDHVDVCELNRQFCLTYEIARAALGDSHD